MFFCFLCSFSSRWNVNEQFRIFSFSNNWQVLRRNSRRAWCSRQDDPLCFHLHFLPSISHYCCFYWDDEGAPFRSNQKCHFLPLVKWEILNTPRKKDLFHVECLKNVAIKLLPQFFLAILSLHMSFHNMLCFSETFRHWLRFPCQKVNFLKMVQRCFPNQFACGFPSSLCFAVCQGKDERFESRRIAELCHQIYT